MWSAYYSLNLLVYSLNLLVYIPIKKLANKKFQTCINMRNAYLKKLKIKLTYKICLCYKLLWIFVIKDLIHIKKICKWHKEEGDILQCSEELKDCPKHRFFPWNESNWDCILCGTPCLGFTRQQVISALFSNNPQASEASFSSNPQASEASLLDSFPCLP